MFQKRTNMFLATFAVLSNGKSNADTQSKVLRHRAQASRRHLAEDPAISGATTDHLTEVPQTAIGRFEDVASEFTEFDDQSLSDYVTSLKAEIDSEMISKWPTGQGSYNHTKSTQGDVSEFANDKLLTKDFFEWEQDHMDLVFDKLAQDGYDATDFEIMRQIVARFDDNTMTNYGGFDNFSDAAQQRMNEISETITVNTRDGIMETDFDFENLDNFLSSDWEYNPAEVGAHGYGWTVAVGAVLMILAAGVFALFWFCEKNSKDADRRRRSNRRRDVERVDRRRMASLTKPLLPSGKTEGTLQIESSTEPDQKWLLQASLFAIPCLIAVYFIVRRFSARKRARASVLKLSAISVRK